MTDQWNPQEKVNLDEPTVQHYREKIAQQVMLPGDTQEWVNAIRALDIVKVRRLLKKERKNFPTQYKRLYRDSDNKILRFMHFMITQFPMFTPAEKKSSTLFLEFEQAKEDGVTHPMLNKQPF